MTTSKPIRDLPTHLRTSLSFHGSAWALNQRTMSILHPSAMTLPVPMTIGNKPVIIEPYDMPALTVIQAGDPAPAGTQLDPEHWISLHDAGWLAKAFPKAKGFFLLLSGPLMICLPPGSKLGLLPPIVGDRRAVYTRETSFSGLSSQGEHSKLTENKHPGDKDAIVPSEKIEWRSTDRREGALQVPC